MPIRLPCVALLALISSVPLFAQPAPPCHTEQARHDRVELRCPWPANTPGLRLEAHFSGSHDDTTATLAATLDGAPVACAAGSKTAIDGQDEGDVTLSCQLGAPPVGAGMQALRFELRWHHARFTGYDLRVAPPR